MPGAAQLRDLVRLDGSVTELLTRAVHALPRLPNELFSVAYRYTLAHDRLVPGELVARGAQDFSKLESALHAISDAPPEFLGVDSTLTSTTRAESWSESAQEAASISECQDYVGTIIKVGEGRFASAGAGVSERMATPRHDQRSYQALNVLLANNLRVRDALGSSSSLELADGVFETNGHQVDVRTASLQPRHVVSELTELVKQRERTADFDVLEGAEALVRWNELARGRYVLLDHVDTDQRRYVICFRMDASVTSPFALSVIEQRVLEQILLGARNKAIASELGVSSPHVSGIAQRALTKLGARSMSELVRVLQASKRVLGDLAVGGEVLVALGYEEATAELLQQLTEAERHVARALLEGHSHREIALDRGVSTRTVATQAASIYRKLEVSGRRELTAKVARSP